MRLRQAASTRFEATYGIAVIELDPAADTADAIAAIRNADAEASTIPDVIDVGLSYGPAAKQEGLLQPYKVSTWATIPTPPRTEGFWYGDYYGVLAFEINTDIVKELPTDWSDLLARSIGAR